MEKIDFDREMSFATIVKLSTIGCLAKFLPLFIIIGAISFLKGCIITTDCISANNVEILYEITKQYLVITAYGTIIVSIMARLHQPLSIISGVTGILKLELKFTLWLGFRALGWFTTPSVQYTTPGKESI